MFYYEVEMAEARRELELAVRFGNEPGDLGRVLAVLAQDTINVLAYCAYCDRQEAVVLLVTDNPHRAKAALTTAGYSRRINSIVLVGATGRVSSAADLGLAGVNILYSYASSTGPDQFYAVFKTNDDVRAIEILGGDHHATARAA